MKALIILIIGTFFCIFSSLPYNHIDRNSILLKSNEHCPSIEEHSISTLNTLFESDGLSERRIELGLEQRSADEFTPLVNETDQSTCKELSKKRKSNPDHFLTTYFKSYEYYVIVNALKPPVFSEDGKYIYISTGHSIVSFYDHNFNLIGSVVL